MIAILLSRDKKQKLMHEHDILVQFLDHGYCQINSWYTGSKRKKSDIITAFLSLYGAHISNNNPFPRLSWTTAWKKHKPNSRRFHSGGLWTPSSFSRLKIADIWCPKRIPEAVDKTVTRLQYTIRSLACLLDCPVDNPYQRTDTTNKPRANTNSKNTSVSTINSLLAKLPVWFQR